MAEENNTVVIAEPVTSDAAAVTPAEKKTRGPGRKKSTAEPAAAPVVAEKPAKVTRAKREEKGVVAKPAKAADTKTAPKPVRAKRVATKAAAPVAASDAFADLLQLEEENKRLRKLLADKLRAENADLTKRLSAR